MRFKTANDSESVSFVEAFKNGYDDAGACYVPADVTPLPQAFYNNICEMAPHDVAYIILSAFVGSDLNPETLQKIAQDWIAYDMPVVKLNDGLYCLEAIHGPTLSVYDYHYRLLSLLLKSFINKKQIEDSYRVIGAGNSDSGVALAHAMDEIVGAYPFLLLPANRLTDIERRQFYNNVSPEKIVVIDGNEAVVKHMGSVLLGSRNGFNHRLIAGWSENVAVIASKVFILFEAYRQLVRLTGNDGIRMLVGLSDECDELAVKTAENLGLPCSLSKNAAKTTDMSSILSEFYDSTGYILHPHSLVQWLDIKDKEVKDRVKLIVQLAHPAKQRINIEPVLNRIIPCPSQLFFRESGHVGKPHHVPPVIGAIKHLINSIL